MKLLLTSAGLVNKKLGAFFVSILPKKPADCSVLMMAYDQTPEDFRHTKEAQEELLVLGVTRIDFFNLQDDKFETAKSFDVIYVCGGNTFTIIDRMKKTGVFEFVKNAIEKNNAIYVGISAGSIITRKSIEIAGWGSEGDINEIGLKDLSGLGFTDVAVYPVFSFFR